MTPQSLTIRRPDNFHVHFRRGELLRRIVPATANVYGRAMVMPNTDPPILDAAAMLGYREEIIAALGAHAGTPVGTFTPLMTIKLTPETTPEVVRQARQFGAVAAKLYPAGVTTGSHGGITDLSLIDLTETLHAMADVGLVLSIHAEVPGTPVLDAETAFYPYLKKLVAAHPRLKIVVEHISTGFTAQAVCDLPDTVAATITPMHLTTTVDDILAHTAPDGRRGLNPHNFCYPVPKRTYDRECLRRAAVAGNPKFFAGDDSAPHHRGTKESSCGCAGAFCAPASLPTYAEVFEQLGALERLEDFTSCFGAAFYGLPPNLGTVTLTRTPRRIPDLWDPFAVIPLVPWRGGEIVEWRVTNVS